MLHLERTHGVGIRDDEAVEAHLAAQHLGEQPAVGGGGNAVEVHVCAHDVGRTGLDSGAERREVDVPQLGVRDVGFFVVATAARRAVPGEVLRPGEHAFGTELALEPTNLRSGDGSAEHRVFARALDDAPPARIARDVDHGREGPVDADRTSLARGRSLRRFDGPRRPARGERDRHGENRAQPVDDVEAEDQRDAEAAFLDGKTLQSVGRRHLFDEERRAGTTPDDGILDHVRVIAQRVFLVRMHIRRVDAVGRTEVEILRQLAGFLLKGEPGKQVGDALLDGEGGVAVCVGHDARDFRVVRGCVVHGSGCRRHSRHRCHAYAYDATPARSRQGGAVLASHPLV